MIKINELKIENVKRVKAVELAPTAAGLTVIGGKNAQGKTSVLDAIAWALGGDKYKPSAAKREGSVTPPQIHIELSNGLIVERSGKNSDLKVIDPSGKRAGQSLLNDFIGYLALDLPKFIDASDKDKAAILLKMIGIGDRLAELEHEEKVLYNRRYEIGRIAEQKAKYAAELVRYEDAPDEYISASDLITRQQGILAKNGENERKRQHLSAIAERIETLTAQIEALQAALSEAQDDLETAKKDAAQLADESTAELENDIQNIEKINIKVRSNIEKAKAEKEAADYSAQYEELSEQISGVRKSRLELLDGADMPLEGLSVTDGELTYNGSRWDCMSAAEQLKAATAIVSRVNPECGFVLLDKLEQMDLDTMNEFGEWLEKHNLQAIATRVSTGEECSIIITDGYAETKKWKDGIF